jgi:hypothetical protein
MPFMGKIRANYMTKDHEQRLLRFADNVRCYDESVLAQLRQNFSSTFNIRKLTDKDIKKYWQNINRTVGSADADQIMKMNEEDRKDLIKVVSQRETANKRARLLGQSVEDSIPTELLAYDILNDITAYAQKVPVIERVALERRGGDMIKQMVLN